MLVHTSVYAGDGCLVLCELRQFLAVYRRISSVYWCTSLSLHLLYVTKAPNLRLCPESSRPDRKVWMLPSCLQKNATVICSRLHSSSHYHFDTHYLMSLDTKCPMKLAKTHRKIREQIRNCVLNMDFWDVFNVVWIALRYNITTWCLQMNERTNWHTSLWLEAVFYIVSSVDTAGL